MSKRGVIVGKQDDLLANRLNVPSPLGLSDVVRYDHSKQQWHVWDGFRWAPDKTRRILDLVYERAAYWYGDDETGEPRLTGEERKDVLPLFDSGKKESVLKALSSRPGIAMTGTEWDPDPELLAFTNGVLNLRTMEFDAEPSPDLLLSRSTGHPWDADADPAEFATFITQIMGGDADLTDYLIRVLGYSLIGWQREQKFWMWVGQGQNGKGTLAKIISAALGDYADTPSSELYMKTRFGAARSDGARPDLLRLQGIRFTWMSEPSGGQFHEEMLKAHTGDDPIQARDLYGKAASFTTFRPTHTINFLTNNPPRTEDVGASMQRRVRVIKFLQDFRGDAEDKGLEERLRQPAAIQGALRLVAFAASRYFSDGLPEPKLVTDWSREYIEENDPLAGFIAEDCLVGREHRGVAAILWAAYQDWAARNDVEPGSQMGFGMALGRRFRRMKTRSSILYLGIKAKSAVEKADEGDDDDG